MPLQRSPTRPVKHLKRKAVRCEQWRALQPRPQMAARAVREDAYDLVVICSANSQQLFGIRRFLESWVECEWKRKFGGDRARSERQTFYVPDRRSYSSVRWSRDRKSL